MNSKVPICYICDENYLLPTVVSISSLLENRNPDTSYEITIVSDSTLTSQGRLLDELRERHGDCEIRILESSGVVGENLSERKNHVTRVALLKYKLCELFPEVDKLLYIDGDTIIQKDLKILCETELGETYLAAAPALIGLDEKYHAWHYDQRIGVGFDEYFNTGVMLLNLAAFRRDGLADRLLEFTEKHQDLIFMDQDAFNVICKGRVTRLGQEFNLMPASKKDAQSPNPRPHPSQATILHFAGMRKPWTYPRAPWAGHYLSHFKKSPATKDYYLNWIRHGARSIEKKLRRPIRTAREKVEHELYLASTRYRAVEHRHQLAALHAFSMQHFLMQQVETGGGWALNQSEERERKLVVSLTSIRPRLYDIATTIESLLLQTVKPDRIVLWLDEQNNSLETLPVVLQRQMERGLSVQFVKDIGPHTKLIPALREHPQDVIVTVDDDILYPADLIERLYREYLADASKIYCTRARHIATLKPEHFTYEGDWVNLKSEVEGLNILPLGVGGVLYPPGILDEEVFNLEAQQLLAPKADDIWFKAMSLKRGVVCKRILGAKQEFPMRPFSQEVSLNAENVKAGGNERQIKACFEHYDLWSAFGTRLPG